MQVNQLRSLVGLAVLVLSMQVAAGAAEGKQYLWQTNAYGDDVHVVEVGSNKVLKRIVVGPEPHGIAAPDDASVVYIAIEAFKKPRGELVWVNPRTYEVEHRLAIGLSLIHI